MQRHNNISYMGHVMRKHVFWHMWTAKAQISLCIHAVWTGPSLSISRIIGYNRMYEWRAKRQMILWACTGCSESVPFAHVLRHFFAWHGQLVQNVVWMFFFFFFFLFFFFISPDGRGIQTNIFFLISPQKHNLWVLIRITQRSPLQWVPTRDNKNIYSQGWQNHLIWRYESFMGKLRFYHCWHVSNSALFFSWNLLLRLTESSTKLENLNMSGSQSNQKDILRRRNDKWSVKKLDTVKSLMLPNTIGSILQTFLL